MVLQNLFLFTLLALLIIHALADCPHERVGLKFWSNESTWGVNGIVSTYFTTFFANAGQWYTKRIQSLIY